MAAKIFLGRSTVPDFFPSILKTSTDNPDFLGTATFAGFTVDFLVGKIWIEFFGLSGELKRYDQLKRSKIRLAKKFNLELLELYPRDLFPKGRLNEILGILA